MNQMSEQDLPNLRGVKDCLITDEASYVANETFCLVVPTDDANCCLWNCLSLRVVGA